MAGLWASIEEVHSPLLPCIWSRRAHALKGTFNFTLWQPGRWQRRGRPDSHYGTVGHVLIVKGNGKSIHTVAYYIISVL
jgi:hypothetical protein